MSSTSNFRVLGAGVGTMAAALVMGCASAPPKADHYVPPATGAVWAYQVTSTGSYGSGVKERADMRMAGPVAWEGRTLLKYETPQGATLQTEKVGVVAVLDRNGRTVTAYDPPLTYEWPLEVGRAWSQSVVMTLASGAKVPVKMDWKVEAYEDVTVPAGTFKAWRIVATDNFGFKQTIWSVPEKMGVFAKRIYERAPTHPQGGAGTQLMELTSVPTVK